MVRRALLLLTVFVVGVGPFLHSPPHANALTGFSTPVVTNLTDVSATVSWHTAQQVFGGSVGYGTTKPPASRASESGTSGALGDVHSVSLGGLIPHTTYFYSVNLGGYTDDNGGAYYTFKTGPTLSATQTNQTVTGKVLKAGGANPAVGVLVVLKVIDNYDLNPSTIQSSGVISTLTNASGHWTISLNNLRTADASAGFIYQTTTPYDFLQYSVSGGSLGDWQSAVVQMGFTSNVMTVPNAILVPGLPTSTPTPFTPTLSPTRTLTTFPTVPTVAPSSTPLISPPNSTPTIVIPTVASTPTLVPVVAVTPRPTASPTDVPVPTPTDVPPVPIAMDTPPASAPEAVAQVPSPQPPVSSTTTPPSIPPGESNSRPTPRPPAVNSAPATLAPMRPFASATILDTTPVPSPSPSPVATFDSNPPRPVGSPGPRPTIALLAGLTLLIVGIVVVTAGVVSQASEN